MGTNETGRTGGGHAHGAERLGAPRMLALGLQNMLAMLGAAVLVPVLTGLSVSAALLFSGLGTLFFHALSKWKIPAFLGSSFAFLAGYWAIAPNGEPELLPYACFGVACSGLLYVILAALYKSFGVGGVMRFFPPVVTGPLAIAIGLTLSGNAVTSCGSGWGIALPAIAVVVVAGVWGKGMVKFIPILLGIAVSYILAACFGQVDLSGVREAPWVGLPFEWRDTVFGLFSGGSLSPRLLITAVITIAPISLAAMAGHLADICNVGITCSGNYFKDPGMHRSLLGDGLATSIAALFGAPANTVYGENTATLARSVVFDPRVISVAAGFAALFSFCPKLAALVSAMPEATLGGVSLVLYGMISASGVRSIVENKVDFSKTRNIIIAAMILVLAVGIHYSAAGALKLGTVSFSGLAVASVAGIVLNALLPGGGGDFDREGPKADS